MQKGYERRSTEFNWQNFVPRGVPHIGAVVANEHNSCPWRPSRGFPSVPVPSMSNNACSQQCLGVILIVPFVAAGIALAGSRMQSNSSWIEQVRFSITE